MPPNCDKSKKSTMRSTCAWELQMQAQGQPAFKLSPAAGSIRPIARDEGSIDLFFFYKRDDLFVRKTVGPLVLQFYYGPGPVVTYSISLRQILNTSAQGPRLLDYF